ncbi:MAG: hypothetical protein AAFR65_13470 [Pseudomonadota bacterium]
MKLGIVCGLLSEKAALGSIDHPVEVSGADPHRAYQYALKLVEEGAEHLVSVGLAGALMPHLQPGDLVLPSMVITADGIAYKTLALHSSAAKAGSVLFGSDEVITTAAAKAKIAQTFDAAVVDMESHAVARAALEKSIRFSVIRAVADGAGQALPPSTEGAVRADGSVDTFQTLAKLLKRPGDLPGLIAVGQQAGKGTRTLRNHAPSLLAALARH